MRARSGKIPPSFSHVIRVGGARRERWRQLAKRKDGPSMPSIQAHCVS